MKRLEGKKEGRTIEGGMNERNVKKRRNEGSRDRRKGVRKEARKEARKASEEGRKN